MEDNRNIDMGEGALQAAAGDLAAYGPTEIVRLVARAVTRDAEAFGELYLIYIDRIYRYVFSYLRDKMTAQDLTEEADQIVAILTTIVKKCRANNEKRKM